MIICPHCQAELPDDAAFCIECGRPVSIGATGQTERLPAGSGPICSNCGVINPPGAVFCVACGRSFAGTVRPVLEREQSRVNLDQPEPQYPLAPVPEPPIIEVPEAPGESRRERRRRQKRERKAAAAHRGPDFSGPLFLIGMAVLFMTGWWWPGMFVLIGLTSAVGALQRGQIGQAIQPAIWFIGIAVLWELGLLWPGVLILIGLSALFSKLK